MKLLGGDEGGRVWCDAGYASPCGFGSPYVSRRVCVKNVSILRGNSGILC